MYIVVCAVYILFWHGGSTATRRTTAQTRRHIAKAAWRQFISVSDSSDPTGFDTNNSSSLPRQA